MACRLCRLCRHDSPPRMIGRQQPIVDPGGTTTIRPFQPKLQTREPGYISVARDTKTKNHLYTTGSFHSEPSQTAERPACSTVQGTDAKKKALRLARGARQAAPCGAHLAQ